MQAAASSSSYADGNNAAQAGGPLEHAASLGSPGRAPSLHDIFYEERAQWRQDLSSACSCLFPSCQGGERAHRAYRPSVPNESAVPHDVSRRLPSLCLPSACLSFLTARAAEFMDGGKVLKRALKRLNSILETARKHEQTIVPNLSMNTTDEIMEYTQVRPCPG